MHVHTLSRRPGVQRCGWLSKEGPHTLSRAFPSRRFCVLVRGALEYYEERDISVVAPEEAGPSGGTKAGTGLGFDVNDWNLVVHVHPGSPASARGGMLVGDVVSAVDGVGLGAQLLGDVVTGHVMRRGTPFRLTVLRPKGEVPLAGASVTQIEQDRLQVAVAAREGVESKRGPYVFIAQGYSERDDWFEAVQAASAAAGGGEPTRGVIHLPLGEGASGGEPAAG